MAVLTKKEVEVIISDVQYVLSFMGLCQEDIDIRKNIANTLIDVYK